jgi:H+/Cl- antiporter ClcA
VAQTLANPVDGFTKFRQTTGFFCDSNFADPFDLAMLAILALLGGVLGALFNQIVEHLSHLRMHHINPSAGKRSLEVLLLVLATGSVAVLLPAAFPCQHATRALMMKDSVGT